MVESILQEYETKLDAKHRCVIHGKHSFDRYHVKVFASGKIEMSPRVLAKPEELSQNALRMIYGSIKGLKKGETGAAVDFKKYRKYLTDED